MQKVPLVGRNELTAGLSFKHEEIQSSRLKNLDGTDLQPRNKFQKKSR